MTYISPSILAANFTALGEQVAGALTGGADMIHVDVMDGVFVPNISVGFPVIKSLSSQFSTSLDVHLMITKPERYIKTACDAGADILTLHIEEMDDPKKILGDIRRYGSKPSIAVKPGTPIETVFPYIEDADMILVMTVEPGFGGQSIMPETIDKVRALRRETERRGLVDYKIEVDGGIMYDNINVLTEAGANVIVMGSAVFGEHDVAEAVRRLKAKADGVPYHSKNEHQSTK